MGYYRCPSRLLKNGVSKQAGVMIEDQLIRSIHAPDSVLDFCFFIEYGAIFVA